MNGQGRGRAVVSLALLFVFLAPVRAEPVLKVLNGRVKKVLSDRHEIVLSSQHPVSGRVEEWVFKVDPSTGFNEGVRLEDLRDGETVSVDYEEGPDGYRRAVQVKRVPLRGIPREIKI